MSISSRQMETGLTGKRGVWLICSKSKVNDGKMITVNEVKTAGEDGGSVSGGGSGLIDNLHPL